MTGTQRIYGPTSGGMLAQIGRWLTLAAVTVAGLFLLFFSAAFALILIGGIAFVALVAVAIFWMRAKLTGRPFGPRATMEARMEELRRQMGATDGAFGGSAASMETQGPIIDLEETPQGWTVER